MKARIQQSCVNTSLEYFSKGLLCLFIIITRVIVAWLIVDHRYSYLWGGAVVLPCILIGLHNWRWSIYALLAYRPFGTFTCAFQFEAQHVGYAVSMCPLADVAPDSKGVGNK